MTTPVWVEQVFAEFAERGDAPAVAYGVVSEGAAPLIGGFGLDQPAGTAIFRIASMTKSFVAAAVLMLRDRGVLRLDEPVARWVPQLGADASPSRAAGAITIGQLLSMSGGLPTDDPWADRLESLTPHEFDTLLARGFRVVSDPGIRFEYSNLGFAILGRIITNAAGRNFRDVIRTELIDPLGLVDTRFDLDELDQSRLVVGHRSSPNGWSPLSQTGPGEFSAIGGLHSTVEDLSRWVGFLLGSERNAGQPESSVLSFATRREMQQLRTFDEVSAAVTDSRIEGVALGYGFGLFVRHSTRSGAIVYHSGGYPGFGSHMCWSPQHRIGVIALANATYAPVRTSCLRVLERLVDEARAAPSSAGTTHTPAVTAVDAVGRLVAEFRDEDADALFASNVDLDEPRHERRARFDDARQSAGPVGEFTVDEVSPARAVGRWHGERADVRVEAVLTPEPDVRIQRADARVVAAPSDELVRAAEAVVTALNSGASAPADVDPADYALAVALGTDFAIDRTRVESLGEQAVLIRSAHAGWLLTGRTGELHRLRLRRQSFRAGERS